MRNIEELIETLLAKDIKLKADKGKLCYNAPPGVITDDLLNEIKHYKSELLELILSKQKEKIKVYQDKEFIPLSFAQNRLWFLDKLEEDSFAYNLPFLLKIEGALNIDAMDKALKYILNRHTVLITSFPQLNGTPYQKINNISTDKFTMIISDGISEADKWDRIRDYIIKQIRKPFDLAAGPLYNIQIIKVEENIHVLLMIFHHIILDGWSIDILMKEIGECYKGFSDGTDVMLPPLEIQYSDFSFWHNEWMKTQQAENQIKYWKKELANAPVLLQIPTVNPRPAIQTLNGKTENFTLDINEFNSLKKLANENGCSLFMVLYAAFSVLLYRYSNQKDILLGTTIANRNRAEIEPLIGLFANTIVLRSDLSGNPSFKEFLMRVKDSTLNAYTNQDIPFEKIVEEIKPERSLSHSPLFQILFELQEIRNNENYYSDLKITAIDLENVSAKFDMNMLLLISDGSLVGSLEYNSDLFNQNYILRFIKHYRNIIHCILENINSGIEFIDYLTNEEKVKINDWNKTEVKFPLHKTFNELFLESVIKHPDKIAAVENDLSITYKELNQRAEILASELIKNDAKPEKVVAILSERGIRFLVSILAVFKSGAAYLPLDPNHPGKRLARIIEQSKPVIVLAEEKFQKSLIEAVNPNDENNIKIILIDDLLERGIETEIQNQQKSAPDNLAYIIFTSGSTGVPKGAMISQKGMINHLYSKIRDLNITADDYIAQNASQCFDISVWQFLAALLAGGTIEIFPDETAHDAEQLLNDVEKNGITILEVVPSFMSVMIDMIEANPVFSFYKLRWLVPTGEALHPSIAVKWFKYFPNIPLINAYGPTECSDDVTHYPIYKVEDIKAFTVPIGKPIANTYILILDKNKQMVPVGVPGELYVGGACVGRGYINDDEKTSQAFIINPYKTGDIIYKSGDLARYLPDGNIEFLGRIDSQVKVRGFRIELGEIEKELHRNKNIKDAVVIVSDDGKDLIGYIVLNAENVISETDIKVYLKQKLPEYMIPANFVVLEKLPLSANGKTDRKALPKPDMSVILENLLLAKTETEKVIGEIWKELLHIEETGINRNFFEIGGHSLLATQLVTRLRDKFVVELPLKTIFEKTTIKDLSEYIDTLLWLKESQTTDNTDDFENVTI